MRMAAGKAGTAGALRRWWVRGCAHSRRWLPCPEFHLRKKHAAHSLAVSTLCIYITMSRTSEQAQEGETSPTGTETEGRTEREGGFLRTGVALDQPHFLLQVVLRIVRHQRHREPPTGGRLRGSADRDIGRAHAQAAAAAWAFQEGAPARRCASAPRRRRRRRRQPCGSRPRRAPVCPCPRRRTCTARL